VSRSPSAFELEIDGNCWTGWQAKLVKRKAGDRDRTGGRPGSKIPLSHSETPVWRATGSNGFLIQQLYLLHDPTANTDQARASVNWIVPPKKSVRLLIVEVTASPRLAWRARILMMLSSLRCTLRTHAPMQAETVALRHQLVVLHRTEQKKRLILRGSDRYVSVKQARDFFCSVAPRRLF